MHCLILQLSVFCDKCFKTEKNWHCWPFQNLDLLGFNRVRLQLCKQCKQFMEKLWYFSHFWHSIRHFVLDTIKLNFYACRIKKKTKNQRSLGIPDISFPWLSPVPMHTCARSQYFNHLKTFLLLHSKHSVQFLGGCLGVLSILCHFLAISDCLWIVHLYSRVPNVGINYYGIICNV